jgi:DNA-binding transcriptional regulator PaaX
MFLNIIEVVGLSDGRVRALLRKMAEDGTIEKIGDKRYASYRLKGSNRKKNIKKITKTLENKKNL